MSFNIQVEGGKSARLPTAGKYCPADILVTATPGKDYAAGYTDGQTAEYHRFWDVLQLNGNASNYQSAFRSSYWTDEIFNPKYPIVCRGGYGSYLTFSGATGVTSTKVPIEIYGGELNLTFSGCTNLVTIPLLKLINVTKYENPFSKCEKLQNITIDGSIDVNFNISATAVLTNDSVQSIIDHLKDLTGQSAQTLTFHTDVGARLTDAQKATITAKNWTLVY